MKDLTGVPSRKVVVLMPFREPFDDVYGGIQLACKEVGAQCEKIGEQYSQDRILDQIYQKITEADIVIADVTTCNPNVMYEVGFAHGLRKQHVVLLVRDAQEVPFDLKHHPHIVYHGKVTRLMQELTRTLEYCIESSARDLTAIGRFFGSSTAARVPVAVVIPLFKPISSGDVSEAATWMTRGDQRVPIYSPTIVLDDYKAYEHINALFADHGLGPLRLVPDDTGEEVHVVHPCVICIGGPRGNRTTRHMLDQCADLIRVEEPAGSLASFVVQLLSPDVFSLKPSAELGLGIIIRRKDPDAMENVTVGVFGDRAESTVRTARFLREEFSEVAAAVIDDVFLVLLAISGPKLDCAEVIYSGTPSTQRIAEESLSKLKKYSVA